MAAERLKKLREELARRGLDGFIVPLADEYLSESVGAYARRLAWLTGFVGSAGTAVVLAERAAIFVDPRYRLQVGDQVDEQHWSVQCIPQTSVVKWLEANARRGSKIGYDPWLHTLSWTLETHGALAKQDVDLIAVGSNPVDAVWTDRPAPSRARMEPHPDAMSGQGSGAKRRVLAAAVRELGADAVVLSALDSIAWTFNVRGRDVEHTPVALAYALVNADATGDLFVAPEKLTDEVKVHLGGEVRLHPRECFAAQLGSLVNKTVVVDPKHSVAGIFHALAGAGAHVLEARNPAALLKAIKNPTEIAGHRTAQVRDGVALCNFLHWLSIETPKGGVTEMLAATRLREFREASGQLRDLSFETISAVGSNAASPHYHILDGSGRRLESGTLYLVDSGGQYLDGTTDVTRTVAVGEPSAEMRDRFTRVLKGHIALARAVFPPGTCGGQLDILARQYLWAVGLDYAHATGHGVGAYLDVHEGPQRIANTGDCAEPLVPGMILSNEPGYYKTGEYGIRIENLVLVVEREVSGSSAQRRLGFETLTFAPIDRALIDISLLSEDERAWTDVYHADVARIVGPHLSGAARAWLEDVTRPLG